MAWGTFIADAAALGLHWIYAQPRVRRAGGETPEFSEPDPANYEGVPAYFAHAGKHAGDLSMYGESALVLLRSLDDSGEFAEQHYARAFNDHFGFGGEYVGYIDGPTRETLVNQIKIDEELREAAMEIPYEGSASKKKSIADKVISNGQLLGGDALREKVLESVRLTKGGDAELALAGAIIDLFESRRRPAGSTSDVQLPALTRPPILLAHDPAIDPHSSEFSAAIRVTHNNDEALAWAKFVAVLIKDLLENPGEPDRLSASIETAAAGAPKEITDEIDGMFKLRGTDNKVYTMKHGPACELTAGVPAALHNLLGAESYVAAVRRNILACGDSCGRAMVVGPIAALMFSGDAGIPEEWSARLTRHAELERRISSVVG